MMSVILAAAALRGLVSWHGAQAWRPHVYGAMLRLSW
jgi:hypothetical protein